MMIVTLTLPGKDGRQTTVMRAGGKARCR